MPTQIRFRLAGIILKNDQTLQDAISNYGSINQLIIKTIEIKCYLLKKQITYKPIHL